MKIKNLLLSSALLACTTPAIAQVSLELPKGVHLLVVNEQDAGYSSLGFNHQPVLALPNGQNQVVFRIGKIVMESGSLKTKYDSVPLIALFDAKDTALTLEVPKIDTLAQGQAYDKSPDFSILNQGHPLKVKSDKLAVGFTLSPDFVQLAKEYNRTERIASIRHIPKPANTDNQTNIVADNPEAEEMLQYWFHQASPETRKAFLSWAIQNMN
ncbi:YccT family protein [Photobacterium sp. R1]